MVCASAFWCPFINSRHYTLAAGNNRNGCVTVAGMSLIENERTKLLATAMNNMAVATIITAVVTPMVRLLYGSQTLISPYWLAFWLLWLFVGVALHLSAQAILGRLKE